MVVDDESEELLITSQAAELQLLHFLLCHLFVMALWWLSFPSDCEGQIVAFQVYGFVIIDIAYDRFQLRTSPIVI